MRHNEHQFRSKQERDDEVRLENLYRQIGNSAILAAAPYSGMRRNVVPQADLRQPPRMAAE